MFVAIQHRIDDVVNTAQIRGLDLHHVATARVGEVHDILIGVTPFIRNNFHAGTQTGELLSDLGEHADLIRLVTGIYRAFNVQRQALSFGFQAGDVFGATHRIHIEDQTDGAVDINMQRRVIGFVGAQAQDAVRQPADVLTPLRIILSTAI